MRASHDTHAFDVPGEHGSEISHGTQFLAVHEFGKPVERGHVFGAVERPRIGYYNAHLLEENRREELPCDGFGGSFALQARKSGGRLRRVVGRNLRLEALRNVARTSGEACSDIHRSRVERKTPQLCCKAIN